MYPRQDSQESARTKLQASDCTANDVSHNRSIANRKLPGEIRQPKISTTIEGQRLIARVPNCVCTSERRSSLSNSVAHEWQALVASAVVLTVDSERVVLRSRDCQNITNQHQDHHRKSRTENTAKIGSVGC